MPAQSVMSPADKEVEETLLGIWREVLVGTALPLDADSNFFLSGGDSLDLVRILVRVRERLGIELMPDAVRELNTPRRMALRCVQAIAARRQVAPARPTATEMSSSYPCSSAQQALWTAEQMAGSCGLYNTAVALHLSGSLNVPVLSRALALLLRRHEVLRSRLLPNLRTRQLMAHVDPVPELALVPQAVESTALRRHLLEVAALTFDLACGPLWRFQLFTTGPGHWTLLFCLHHAVTDGWSGSVLLRNLAETYNALLLERACESVPHDHEFALWCRRQVPVALVELHWWRKYLDGADRLPGWPPTGAHGWPFALGSGQLVLDGGLAARIRTTVRRLRMPPSVLFLTALRRVLAQYAGLREACIAVPVNVRDSSAQENAVGYFVNLLVTRASIAADMPARTTLECVQRSLADALSHRNASFAELARELRPVPLPSGNAWCDVLFAFQNLPRALPQFVGLQLQVEALPLPYGQHPLKLEVLCPSGGYACCLEYARDYLAPAEAEVLLAAFQAQLEALLAGCTRSS